MTQLQLLHCRPVLSHESLPVWSVLQESVMDLICLPNVGNRRDAQPVIMFDKQHLLKCKLNADVWII